jgi:carboxylate-amine ligase
MSDDRFTRNSWPTLGVEVELQIVDGQTMALKSGIAELLAELPVNLRDSVKPEFMQCYIEINTDVCRTAADVEADLVAKLRAARAAAVRSGSRLLWSATHPFSRWQDQRITPNERYLRLADQLRETVTRPVTFGMHVHVGVPSGEHAIRVSNLLQPHLPLLLALSANSPFWQGRTTGHHAHRIEVLEGFPTGGLPPKLGGWGDYLELVRRMTAAGFIESPKEIWWDVRPSPASGTVEVRICDMPPDLPTVIGLTALTQCLVFALSVQAEEDAAAARFEPLMVRQNRWRAARFGLGAEFVDPTTLQATPARALGRELIERLAGVARRLGCASELGQVSTILAGPSGAERQTASFERTGNLAEVVRESLDRADSFISPGARATPPMATFFERHPRMATPLPPGAILS